MEGYIIERDFPAIIQIKEVTMLVVKPSPDNSDNEIKTLNAFIDDEPRGYIRFRLNGYIIVVTELAPLMSGGLDDFADKELYPLLDTLIRALGSYGLNHSCFYIECDNPALYPTLSKLRFKEADGIMKSNLQMLLKTCG